MDYNYIVFTIEKKDIDEDIFDTKNDIIKSPYITEPMIKYGFYSFQHQSKDKMPKILNESEFKGKTLHLVTNQFEHFITDNKQDIIHTSLTYFNLKSKKDIINRSFFVLWELLISYDLINDNKSFKTLNISNNMALNQCISFYRNKFYKSTSNNDIYYSFDKNKEYIDSDTSIEDIGSESDINNVKFNKNIKNINDLQTINNICKEYNESIDLVVTDINIIWNDHNYQEQESFKTIISQIYCSLNVLKKDGNLVLKCYESFSEYTIKLMIILTLCFDNIYITKPLISRPSNSERFIICTGYKSKKTNETKIKKLYEIIEEIYKTKDMYIVDIFSEYKINDNLQNINKLINTIISNNQFKSINEMMTYLKSGNYFGDEYNKYIELQTKANDYWVSMFYPVSLTDLNNLKKILDKKINDSINILLDSPNKNTDLKPIKVIEQEIKSTKTIKKTTNKSKK